MTRAGLALGFGSCAKAPAIGAVAQTRAIAILIRKSCAEPNGGAAASARQFPKNVLGANGSKGLLAIG